MIKLCWLIPFLPLLGAFITAVGGRWLKLWAHIPVIAGIALAFLIAVPLWNTAPPSVVEPGERVADAPTVVVYDWIDAGDLHVPISLRADGLSTMMAAMVTFVALLIAIFAVGYMEGDPGFVRFFAEIGLFVASMTGLVLSNNYVLTYGCWEGVGVCSYLLIGFWHSKPAASAAAKKAFLVNRLGDLGFALALFWLWSVVPHHDLGYDNVLSNTTLTNLSAGTKIGLALLLFWAATAKSAQIPLYVWLPDAMEGPTPVSALIHAATMVTAGVYLIARSAPLVMLSSPIVPLIICVIGCATALLSASIAVTQYDLKRVLAYSTISQLGYMFMALGSGVGGVMRMAVIAAMFHLFTHAFFKALLFLGAGSVMTSMGHVIDMRRFGGLRHRMPITCITFAVGGLALSGIVPFAGFWSKEEILATIQLAAHTARDQNLGWGWLYVLIFWTALFTAFLTAFYTGRAFFLTFWGPEKLPTFDAPESEPEPHGHDPSHDPHFGHESPRIMTIPLIVLAAGALLVGMIFGPTHWFSHHLERTPGLELLGYVEPTTSWLAALGMGALGTVVGLAGLGLSYWFYAIPNPIPARLATRLRPLYEASYRKFWVDEIYNRTVIAFTWFWAHFCRLFDEYVVDGLVGLTAWMPRFVGRDLLAPFQNGLIQFYAAVTALGLTVLMLYLLMI